MFCWKKLNVQLSTGFSKCFCLCFSTLWLFSNIPCPCQIGQSILTKSFLFTWMSERPRHFDRLSTLATKSGSLSNIYSICTRLRFKKTNAVFQKCKLQWKCHKTFLSDSAIFYQKQSKQFPIYSPQKPYTSRCKVNTFSLQLSSNKSKTNWYWGPVFFVIQSSKEDRTATDNYTLF